MRISFCPYAAHPNQRVDTFDDEDGEEYNASAFGGFGDYFRRKKIKLQNLDVELKSQAQDNPQIFKGIVVHVNGYTQPSLNDLHKLIVQHGGGFVQYLDNKTMVTHIIASSLTPKKAVEFKKYRIVKPAWIVDSVKAGKVLPWNNYKVIDEGAGQKVLGFDNGKVVSQATAKSRGYKEQTETSWYTEQLKASDIQSQRSGRAKDLAQPLPTSDATGEIEDGLPPPLQARASDAPLSPIPTSSEPDLEDSPQMESPGENVSQTEKEIREEGLRKLKESEQPSEIKMVQDEMLQDLLTEDQETMVPETEDMADPTSNRFDDVPASQGTKRPISDNISPPSKRTKITAEEHNAILLADPRIRKTTAVNPGFLEQYYRESRLHHLSTWKAELKSEMQSLASNSPASQMARQKRPSEARQYIMHVDFDSFFAAVSLKKFPQYIDKPAVVAHGNANGGSEIASCNYPARKFGIKNGMWMNRAKELCPDLKVLPYDFPAYEDASRAFYEAIIATGGVVQSVSVDEALVDISTLCIESGGTDGIRRSEGALHREEAIADEIGQKLRDQIRAKTKCEVSVGIGGNILLAKLALRKAKPAGQYHLRPDDVLDFIGELQVQSLPGVAWSLGGKLEELGVKLVKDLRELSKERLINALGPKTGERLYEYARGIDRKEVGDLEIRKSVSAEVSWGVRFVTQEQVDEFMESLCGELNRRLLKEQVKGKQLSLKVMRRAADAPLDPPKHLGHGKCDVFNKSTVLGVATNDQPVIAKEALSMLKSFGFSPGELRGLGVQMVKLEPIKAVVGGKADSSQRRLQFKIPTAEPKEPETRKLSKLSEDPIEDIITPKKKNRHPEKLPFGADQLNQSTPTKKPLNTLGTQFILPTQVDPQVLAELPEDIRARLAKHVQATQPKHEMTELDKRGRAAPSLTALPNQSQLDPEILKSLPEDIRAEVLSFYEQSPGEQNQTSAKSRAVQSPSKSRGASTSKRVGSAPSRRGRPSRTSARGKGSSTLAQANFIAARTAHDRDGGTPNATDTEGEDVAANTAEGYDPEVLAALPDDIRRELLDDQRRKRLQKTAGLQYSSLSRARKSLPRKDDAAQYSIARMLKVLPRPPKPTFSMKRLSALPELRDAVWEWVREFKDEGPYGEDADALAKYLGRVIGEEGNMDKAVNVLKWFAWVLGEEFEIIDGLEEAKSKWDAAFGRVRAAVQTTIRDRGLGDVVL